MRDRTVRTIFLASTCVNVVNDAYNIPKILTVNTSVYNIKMPLKITETKI